MTNLSPINTNEITAILDTDEYEFYGLRTLTIVDEADEDRAAPLVGDTLGNSRVWVDGDMTDEELNGTCTYGLTRGVDVERALRAFAREGYYGNYTVLVGGQSAERGEDNGELIIRGARVLAVWTA